MMVDTLDLRQTDQVIKRDAHDRVSEIVNLKTEIPTLGCLGRHFICEGGNLVCYGRGRVEI